MARRGTLAIREWGPPSAPNLVFLHGLGVIGPRATDEPAEAWAALVFRVLAPDLPGFGGSEAVSREDYLPSRLARRLLGELPERFALVGYSWGGTIGAHLTALEPERVTALVLVDVGYSAPKHDPPSYDELLSDARAELGASRFPDMLPPSSRTRVRSFRNVCPTRRFSAHCARMAASSCRS